MNKITMMITVIMAGYVRFALAGTKSNQEPGILFWVLAAILAPILIYSTHKWQRWVLGFKFGAASRPVFLSALKWSFASLLTTIAAVLVFSKFG